ncbi:hypothetical protein JGI1_02295, partial [Candidatus Thermokryptus mobilis]
MRLISIFLIIILSFPSLFSQVLSDRNKALNILRGIFSSERFEMREREHESVKNYMKQVLEIYKATQIKREVYKKDGGGGNFRKVKSYADRKSLIMNGNKVMTVIYNYGAIGAGPNFNRRLNVVWNDLPHIYEFSPLVAASVVDTSGRRIHVVSDGLRYYSTVSPDGTEFWTFNPLPGYADPNQDKIAHNPDKDRDGDGKPDSWPASWYDPVLGKYVWPGYLSRDATQADLEAFYVMDDRDNKEHGYFPFPEDSTRRGLGVQVQVRALQWSNPLAEDCIFFVYTITNVSPKKLDSVIFGMYGDADIGGGAPTSNEQTDDDAFFVPPYNVPNYPPVDNIPVYARSMVYIWDHDGKGEFGLKPGYFGYKFLESPGNPYDGIDNDGDGMVDESQQDGIDNDGDWNPLIDDVGVDGIPGTGDEGEGDGIPTRGRLLPDGSLDPLSPGEPNFEFTDLDESDMIGLTSFNAFIWSTDYVSNDENIWNRLKPGNFSEIVQTADN